MMPYGLRFKIFVLLLCPLFFLQGQLYQLLSDQGFLLESAVWETLTDIDATFSEFVDGNFQPFSQHESNSEDIAAMTKEQQINSE